MATTNRSTATKSTPKEPANKAAPKQGRSPHLLEREPRAIVEDAAFAAAALASDAADLARILPAKVRELGDEAPARVRELREDAAQRFDRQLARFEAAFDDKAKAGRKVAKQLTSKPQVKRVLDQTQATRSQLKGALTSVRKTADVALEAGKLQAVSARTQVKAAATSTRKTAETIASAAKETAQDLAS